MDAGRIFSAGSDPTSGRTSEPCVRQLAAVAVHGGELNVSTRGDADIVDITGDVARIVGDGPIDDGPVTAFVRGSTAAITTRWSSSPAVKPIYGRCSTG